MSGDTPPASINNRRVAKSLGTTLLARLGGLVELVAQPLYVAMFGLASYGFYAVLWAAINLLENIFDFGTTSAMQRTVPQASDDRSAAAALRSALVIGVGSCLLVAIFVFLNAATLAPLLNVAQSDEPMLVPALRLFIWALPLWAFVEIATSSLRARHLFGAEIRLRIFWEQVIRMLLAIAAWALGYGVFGLFVAHMASLGVTSLLSLRLVLRHYHWQDILAGPFWPPIAGETARAGLAALPANILARLFGDAPVLVLNLLLPGAEGARAGGLFTIARKLSSVVQLVRTAFAYVLAPLVSSAVRHDPGQVQSIYAFATRMITAVALPLSCVLAAGALPLLSLFGPEAYGARAALILLLMARMGEAVFGSAMPVQQVASGYTQQVMANVLGAGIALVAGVLLHPLLPALTAITLAVAIGLVSTAIIPTVQLAAGHQLHPFDQNFRRIWPVVPAALCGAAAALPTGSLPAAIALPLLTVIAAAAIWCSLRFGLSQEDRMTLGKTARRLRLV